MFKTNKTPNLYQAESLFRPSSQRSLNFDITPSHLTISHHFATSIKPKTYFQLQLIKDRHQSSEINHFLNVPIHAKVFQGKIVISNVRLSFTVDFNSNFQSLNNFYLRLIQLRAYDFQQDTIIGEYQLDINDLIKNFIQKQSNYFYQQCVLHSEVYLTYEVFVETSRVLLEELIAEKRKQQKKEMKNHILKSLEDKKKEIQYIKPNTEDQKQIKEVVKAHLTVLNHLDQQKTKNDAQSELNFKHTKVALEPQDHVLQTPGYSLKNTAKDMLDILSEDKDLFSIKSSHIDFRQEIQMPEFKGSKVRKTASLAGEMNASMSREDSMILRNDSSELLRNESELILIDVKQPRAHDHKSHHDSVITFNGKTLDVSELSLDNEFEAALKRIVEGEFRMKGQRKRVLPLLEQFETESLMNKKNRQTTMNEKNQNLSLLSQITLQEPVYTSETQNAKRSFFMVVLVAIILCIFLIDDPSFDLFEDKHYTVVDGGYLKNKKRSNKHEIHVVGKDENDEFEKQIGKSKKTGKKQKSNKNEQKSKINDENQDSKKGMKKKGEKKVQ